ncbi:MAG TPA: cytochrome ubiquinol oxidase subunit I, partial [Acidimicrobiales bacterium]|nr:cytochrome ubiquinol oxidase subunit I [Acidimicrobiales bacterium]
VGYVMKNGQPQLTNIWALFTNPVFLWAYAHVLLASLVTGSVIMLGVSAWHLHRKQEVSAFHRTAVVSLVVLMPAIVLALFVGSELGVVEETYQPMKIAAAEALWETCPGHCSFSAFQIGGGNNDEAPTQIWNIPDLLSILATNHVDGTVQGLNNLNAMYQKEYGPGDYIPNVFIQYWSMRVMAYLASLVLLFAVWGGWVLYRHRLDHAKWFLRIAPWVVIAPFLMNTAGWMLTENGRQPWIVEGLMLTAKGVSSSVSATDIWISLIAFYLIYLVLGIACAWLMIRYSRRPLGQDPIAKLLSDRGDRDQGTITTSVEPEPSHEDDDLALVY